MQGKLKEMGFTHEDKPCCGPGLPNKHAHVFARNSESVHTDEIHHPVYNERSASVR